MGPVEGAGAVTVAWGWRCTTPSACNRAVARGCQPGPGWNAAGRAPLALPAGRERPLQVPAQLNEQGAVEENGRTRLHRTRTADREQPQRV